MRSVKSLTCWKIAAARLVFVIVVVMLAVGLRIGWSQEAGEPRLDEEFTKQDKIYRTRGANVPSRYVTTRGLSHYEELLPTGFCDALAGLGSADRWLDIGAGTGGAILDYFTAVDPAAPTQKCGRSATKGRAVAMSIEDRRTEKWRARAASVGDDHMRYLHGKPLRRYSSEELGKFQIITDVFGGFTYTQDLSQFVDKVLGLLNVGGAFYTLMAGVQLENSKNKLGTWYVTELVNPMGRQAKVCTWLKQTTCVQVTCESKGDWDMPTELIRVRKVCDGVSVPSLKLLEFRAGVPPERRFELSR